MANSIRIIPDFIASKQVDGASTVSNVRCLDSLGLDLSLDNLAVAVVGSVSANSTEVVTPTGRFTPLSRDAFSYSCKFYSVKNTGQTVLEATITGANLSSLYSLPPGAKAFVGSDIVDTPTISIFNTDTDVAGEYTVSFTL